jgi:hypothetical protein
MHKDKFSSFLYGCSCRSCCRFNQFRYLEI